MITILEHIIGNNGVAVLEAINRSLKERTIGAISEVRKQVASQIFGAPDADKVDELAMKICKDCKSKIEYLADFPGPRCLKCHAKKYENAPLERPNFVGAIRGIKTRRRQVMESLTKRAVIRDPSAPIGKPAKCHVKCGCGTKVPVSDPDKEITDRTCPKCKTTYDERGYIKESEVTEAFHEIGHGDRVTIMTPHQQKQSGRAVMRSQHGGWVLNMGGRYGTPGIADERNYVSHRKAKDKTK